jgi:hypothetical protein
MISFSEKTLLHFGLGYGSENKPKLTGGHIARMAEMRNVYIFYLEKIILECTLGK